MLNFGFPGYVESNHAGIGPLTHVQRFAPDETGAADHEGDARRETHRGSLYLLDRSILDFSSGSTRGMDPSHFARQ